MSKTRTTGEFRLTNGGTGPLGNHSRKYVEVVVQSAKDMIVDGGPQWAAAVAYYAVLSVVPLLLVIATLVSFFVDPQWATERVTNMLGDFAPRTEGTIDEIVNNAIAARGRVGLLAFVGLLVTGSRVFDALTSIMNIAFNVDDDYTLLQRVAVQLFLMLTVGAVFVAAIVSGLMSSVTLDMLRLLPGSDGPLIRALTWIVRMALLVAAFFLVYRYVPRRGTDWRAALVGAVTATALFAIVSPIFGYYLGRFAAYNVIYGSLGVIVVLIIWIGISSNIVVFGAEIASHTRDMVFEGRGAEEVGNEHLARSPGRRAVHPSMPNMSSVPGLDNLKR